MQQHEWIDTRLDAIVLMGGGGSQQPAGETTTTQKSEPWSGQQPYLSDIFSQAQGLNRAAGPNYFPGSTVGAQSPQTSSAISNEYARGVDGSPVDAAASSASIAALQPGALYANPGNSLYGAAAGAVNPALGLAGNYAQGNLPGMPALSNIASGSSNTNPFLQDQWNALKGDITHSYQTTTAPQIDGAFEGAGRYGSGAASMARANGEQALAGQLATAGSNLLSTNYQDAANRQLSAAGTLGNLGIGATSLYGQLGQNQISNLLNAGQGFSSNYDNASTEQGRLAAIAPTLAGEDVKNLALQQDAGSQIDARTQALLNDQIQRYNFDQMQPYNKLANYMQMVQGNYGSTSTTTQPYFSSNPSQLGGALTGAAGGAAIGTMLGPGYGTALGAGIGGLLGMFGSR